MGIAGGRDVNGLEEEEMEGREEYTEGKLLERLEAQPELKARVVRLLEWVENEGGEVMRASEAGERTHKEIKELGREVMRGWAGHLAEEAGRQLKRLAELSGLKPKSQVHGLGDGAPWIAEQMEVQFGAQGSYLIDFYHLCDYLAAAAPRCAPQTPQAWLEEQKTRFKTGQQTDVLTTVVAVGRISVPARKMRVMLAS
jgi:hypothetical protein